MKSYYKHDPMDWTNLPIRYRTRERLEAFRYKAGRSCKTWDVLLNGLIDFLEQEGEPDVTPNNITDQEVQE